MKSNFLSLFVLGCFATGAWALNEKSVKLPPFVGLELLCYDCPNNDNRGDMAELEYVWQQGVAVFDFYAEPGRVWVPEGQSYDKDVTNNGNIRRFLRAVTMPDMYDEQGTRRLVDNCNQCQTRACRRKWCNGGGRRRLQEYATVSGSDTTDLSAPTGSTTENDLQLRETGRNAMEAELKKVVQNTKRPDGAQYTYTYDFILSPDGNQ